MIHDGPIRFIAFLSNGGRKRKTRHKTEMEQAPEQQRAWLSTVTAHQPLLAIATRAKIRCFPNRPRTVKRPWTHLCITFFGSLPYVSCCLAFFILLFFHFSFDKRNFILQVHGTTRASIVILQTNPSFLSTLPKSAAAVWITSRIATAKQKQRWEGNELRSIDAAALVVVASHDRPPGGTGGSCVCVKWERGRFLMERSNGAVIYSNSPCSYSTKYSTPYCTAQSMSSYWQKE